MRGRLSPFIELGVGFNPDLTARDNVIINAIMLGLTRKQARERFDEIIAFAELEEFLDLKLKNYSSGMSVRLAFSVAIQVDADVLLVDEVLAVGDAAFQQKCFEQFHRLKDEGKTIVFVTHDMSAVERFCDRAMLLERGRIVVDRRAARDRARLQRAQLRPRGRGRRRGTQERFGDHEAAEIKEAWFEDAAGERVDRAARRASRCSLCMEVAFHAPVEHPLFLLHLRNEVAPHGLRDLDRPARPPDRARSRRASVATVRVAMRELARARPLRPHADRRARRRRRRRARPARGPRLGDGPRHAPLRRRDRGARTRSSWSAREHRPRPPSSTSARRCWARTSSASGTSPGRSP